MKADSPSVLEPIPAHPELDNPHESEDFDMWVKTLGASPNIEDGLKKPESSEIPLFPAGDANTNFTGASTRERHSYMEDAISKSLPSLHLLATRIPDA